jgi:hypothetical protein
MRILTALRCTLALALVSVATGAFAQGWPSKPVKFIVPFPPGGGAGFEPVTFPPGPDVGKRLQRWECQLNFPSLI